MPAKSVGGAERAEALHVVGGSPPCTPYAAIQTLNMRTEKGKAKEMEARRRGEVHLKF